MPPQVSTASTIIRPTNNRSMTASGVIDGRDAAPARVKKLEGIAKGGYGCAMLIATWNVNSLRVRLEQLLEWLAVHQPEIVALQETKVTDQAFPVAQIERCGYGCVFNGKKSYNGAATLARRPLSEAVLEIPSLDDQQRRVLAVSCDGVRVVNLYVPNGQSLASDKYEYKLRWLKALRIWLR